MSILYKWIGPIAGLICLIAVIVSAVVGYSHTINQTVDLSWPNCSHLPADHYSEAILGVTGGLDFSANPCLGQEIAVANSYELYVNTGNPGFPRIKRVGIGPKQCAGRSLVCYSYNYGYQAGLYALKRAELAGAHSPFWWLDVETDNSWTSSIEANRADIAGMINAIQSRALFRPVIGIYTASIQWVSLVSHWKIGLPLWLGTGDTSIQKAATDCRRPSVTGGLVLLTQYTVGQLDYNYVCIPRTPDRYF